jgi:hypothetical protein
LEILDEEVCAIRIGSGARGITKIDEVLAVDEEAGCGSGDELGCCGEVVGIDHHMGVRRTRQKDLVRAFTGVGETCDGLGEGTEFLGVVANVMGRNEGCGGGGRGEACGGGGEQGVTEGGALGGGPRCGVNWQMMDDLLEGEDEIEIREG